MKLHYGYNDLKLVNPVVTMGTFDGVHSGHVHILETLKRKAADIKGESVVITFYPHPRQVLNSEGNSLMLLTTLGEKIELMEDRGIDHLIIVEFNKGFSNKEACEFIEEILSGTLRARMLIVGFNHHFGKSGSGDFYSVKNCAERNNLQIEMVNAITSGDTVISSSVIRDALLSGRLDEANHLLGYPYFVNGVIVEGKKLGRKIGYPTANISISDNDKLVPANGVYAVDVIIDGLSHKGVMSVGINPTVNKDPSLRTIEVNIFDFTDEIYGREVKVIFRYRLRDEMTFDSLSELAAQIEIDKIRASEMLTRE